MSTKTEIITEAIEMVRDSVTISHEIVEDIKLIRSGQSFKGLCPFHNDHKIGSFIVTDNKKIFKCFSCGTGGDVIKYVSLRKNISYSEAGLNLALKYGKLSKDDYDYAMGKGITTQVNNKIEKIYMQKDKEKFNINRADSKILNKVYSVFIRGNSHKKGKRLSDEHKKHLIDERKLTEEEIEKRGYFSFPNKTILEYFLNNLEKELINDGLDLDILKEVPGFLYDNKKETWSFMSISGGGIGIPLKNQKNEIYGIQIRKDTIKEGEQRYIWFSSAFAQSKDNLSYGVSSGSPVDVVIPNGEKTKTLFITEGHFKACVLSKEFNAIALSVQGVCSWGNVVNMVSEIKEAHNIKSIYIAYDSDMAYNICVFQQAINMGVKLYGLNPFNSKEKIKNEIEKIKENSKLESNIKYAIWDEDYGKGIDDIILNNHKQNQDKITNLGTIDFENLYKDYIDYIEVLEERFVKTGKFENINKIDKECRKELYEQHIFKKAVFKKTK